MTPRKLFTIAIALIVLFAPLSTVTASDIYVSNIWGFDDTGDGSQENSYHSIQKAVDVANDHDEILIHDSFYYETVIINGKRVAIKRWYGDTGLSMIQGKHGVGGISPSPGNPGVHVKNGGKAHLEGVRVRGGFGGMAEGVQVVGAAGGPAILAEGAGTVVTKERVEAYGGVGGNGSNGGGDGGRGGCRRAVNWSLDKEFE